jgi:hypothetical protein
VQCQKTVSIQSLEEQFKTEVHIAAKFMPVSKLQCSTSIVIHYELWLDIRTEILYEIYPYFQGVVPACEDVALDVADDVVEVLLEFLELHHVPPVRLSLLL